MRATSWGSVPPLVSHSTRRSAPACSAARTTASAYAGFSSIPVEEVLRVEERAPTLRDQHATSRPPSPGSPRASSQRLGHVEVPRLPDQAHDGVPASSTSRSTGLLPAASPARRVMPNAVSVLCRSLPRGEPEELGVARVGARPAALDERHADRVERVQDLQLVLDRELEPRPLGAIPERGVVDLATHWPLPPPPGRRPRRWRTPSRRPASTASSRRPRGCRPRPGRRRPARPSVSSIRPAAPIAATGLMVPVPTWSGAVPPIGSNIDTPSGLRLAPAATPMPPCTVAARSVRMSPNMLSVTTTSNRPGSSTR